MYKTVAISILSTAAVITLIFYMFLNSILATFGLVATSVDTLNSQHESKRVLEVMRQRHAAKEINISKKFIKRSGKKVAVSAVSAASIGTAAVVIAIAGMEAVEYCDEKKELMEEGEILFNKKSGFDYTECLKEATNDSSKILASVKSAMSQKALEAWEGTMAISERTWESIKDTSMNAWASTAEAGSNAWLKTSEKTSETWASMLDWASKESKPE